MPFPSSTIINFSEMKTFNNNPSYTGITTGSSFVTTIDITGTLIARNGNSNYSFVNNQLVFGYSNTSTYAHAIKTRHDGGNNANNAIDFYVWQTSDASTTFGTKRIMSVTATGVSIGTTTSNTNQLSVKGDNPQIYIQPTSAGSETSLCFVGNASTNWFMGTNVSGIGSGSFGITVPGTNILTFNTAGNVGLGYTNPQNVKLRVTGSNSISFDYGNYIKVQPESAWTSNNLIGCYWDGSNDVAAIWAPGATHANNGSVKMLLYSYGVTYINGYLGVTTASPSYALDAGTGSIIADNWIRSRGSGGIYNESYGGGWYMSDSTWLRTWDKSVYTNTGYICNNTNARFGAGTSAPSYPFHVATADGYPGSTYYGYLSPGGTGTATDNPGTSVYCSQRMLASEFNAISDERVKTNISDINDLSALDIIRQIEPKRYNYVDYMTRGQEPVWGFIAQQVESVLNYAVTTTEDYIPNIFELANLSESNGIYTITLPNKLTSDTLNSSIDGIITPIQLKIYTNNDGKEKHVTLKDIIDEHSFTVNESLSEIEPVQDDITGETKLVTFVYGIKINNFKNLDKHAIFTMATAALQEVDRELQSTKERLNTVNQTIQTRQQTINNLTSKINTIKNHLNN